MAKLISNARSSKLKNTLASISTEKTREERVTNHIKVKEYPRSYRLDYEIMNTLKSTLNKINEISPKKVSEARLIKALILLSQNIEEERIIKALKEVW